MGVYERLKASWVYQVYWTIMDSRIVADGIREAEFYRHTLQGFQRGHLIFDVGANHGHKTSIFLRLGAKVVAVEPDDANQEKLRQRFLEYRLTPKPVRLVAKALSDSNSVATMWVDAPGSAKNTMSLKWVTTLREDEKRFGERLGFSGTRKVETTTVEDLIDAYGIPFFIKIDVEGHEVSVLRGMKRPVPYLSFEVNLPEFASEGLECIELLNKIAGNGEFNYVADLRAGLELKQWLPHQDFVRLFEEVKDSSIEVFWRTPVAS
jgi:FkbM family methyltransferase